MVILGLWLAIIGWGVTYTGMQKLGGDATYSLAKAFKGVAPSTTAAPASSASTTAGTTRAEAQAAAAAQQGALIGSVPLAQGDPSTLRPGGPS